MTSLFVVGSLHWDVVVNAPSIPRHDETIVGHSVNYAFGGKGGNLAEMSSIGLPVPPGFTISTDVCTHY